MAETRRQDDIDRLGAKTSEDDKHAIEHHDDVEADKRAAGHVADTDAAEYINPDIVIDEAENKRLRRLIHKKVLPIMCVAYLTQALDKGTLGSSSIMGWQKDVGAVGQDYALTSTMLWIGIIVGEPVANQFVRRLPVAKVLGYAMIIWSTLVMGLAFSLTIPPVFVIRVLLGFFESCFGPCLTTITVQWYLKEEQPAIQAIWQSMFGVASLVSSLLAYGFYHLSQGRVDGRMAGWQWMTVCLSLISFIASGIVLWFLPDSPTRARWASEEDKVKFVERVRKNDQGIKQKVFRKDQVWEAFRDPYSWLLCLLMVFQTLVVGGVNTFNSLLINQGFGFSVLTSQLLGIPLAVDTVLLYFLMAYLVSKTGQTVYCMIGYVIVNVIGTVVLITVAPTASTRPGLIVAFYLMQCFQACSPPMFSMLSRNVAGQTKKSITYAMFFVGWAVGNAIAPQIFQSKWAPRYLNSLYIHLGLYACFIATALTMRVILVRRNKQKIAAQTTSDGRVVNLNAHAFEDLTDLSNPDFRYSV